MSKQRKRKYLQIVVTFLCICMLGGFSGKQVHAETGYALIPKVKEAQTGWFVKYWSGWKYIYANGKCPKNKWKKINNKIYYFDKNGYMQTGWKKYKNSWYYLRKSGKNKGALCTGWKTISGKRYFLALTANRHTHKAYIKVRENNYSLNGLMGVNLYKKTAGIVGTGKIGAAMARICHGFGMKVIGYDMYPNKDLDFVEYVDLDTLLSQSDLISLHCPLMEETHHMINIDTIQKMKDGVILVNTSRGGLIKTDDLIQGIRENKFFAVGLDVYEEENGSVYEDMSETILEHSTVARLLSFPNVMVTSHQAFFTEEALAAISEVTLDNAMSYLKGTPNGNEL